MRAPHSCSLGDPAFRRRDSVESRSVKHLKTAVTRGLFSPTSSKGLAPLRDVPSRYVWLKRVSVQAASSAYFMQI